MTEGRSVNDSDEVEAGTRGRDDDDDNRRQAVSNQVEVAVLRCQENENWKEP